MSNQVFIITGTTNGIGKALATLILTNGIPVFSLSKKEDEKLKELSLENNTLFINFTCDLSSRYDIQYSFSKLLKVLDQQKFDKITLVNNAGLVAPVSRLKNADWREIDRAINVNLLAPLLICSSFVKFFDKRDLDKTILNISSGASIKPYHGWSVYCSTKAALNHMTQCLSLEQENENFPVNVYALAPGVVDTKMQIQVRNAKESEFTDKNKFVEIKDNNTIWEPSFTALEILKFLKKDDLINGNYYDLRDYTIPKS